MKRILTFVALVFLLGYNADAQQVLQDFSKAVSSHCANVSYSYKAVSGALGIADLAIWFRREAGLPVLSRARATMGDGTMLEFTFKSMSWSDKVPESEFSFDMSKAQKSWIITDLR